VLCFPRETFRRERDLYALGKGVAISVYSSFGGIAASAFSNCPRPAIAYFAESSLPRTAIPGEGTYDKGTARLRVKLQGVRCSSF
jgi:hypothetical protein